MGFPTVTKQEIIVKLGNVGVKKGDLIYVASYMPILGNSPSLLDDTIDALTEAVGKEGTVVMPTFNYDYCKGSLFDPTETPSQVGVLTENFRKRPGVLRSFSPPWCTFAACGKRSDEIVKIKGTSSFGIDGIPQYLYDANTRYVLLGCPYADAVIHIHWLEEKFEVPYRYWKQFKGKVRIAGKIENNVSYMFARRLDVGADIEYSHLAEAFEKTGKVNVEKLGLGHLRSFKVKDFVDFMNPYFEKDKLIVLLPEARKYFE